MECVLVWLAVMAATFHMAQTQCTDDDGVSQRNGTLIVRGIHTTNFAAGRLEVCVGTQWGAVCSPNHWDDAARVACRQLRFTGTISCGGSCFGRSNLSVGIIYFGCNGDESQLTSCSNRSTPTCGQDHAGVVCSKRMDIGRPITPTPISPTTTCPTCPPITCPTRPLTTCPTTCPPIMCPIDVDVTLPSTKANADTEQGSMDTVSSDKMGGAQQSCPSLAALGGGLGALTAILAILLVGVVIGWVWYCRRKTEKSSFQERPFTSRHLTFPNPSYTATSPTTHAPSVQYSSLGPRGTPLNHTPSAAKPTPPAIYDVINEQRGERVYHVLEGPHEESGRETEKLEDGGLLREAGGGEELDYEVPISSTPSQPAAAQPGGEPMDTEYSKLQHQ